MTIIWNRLNVERNGKMMNENASYMYTFVSFIFMVSFCPMEMKVSVHVLEDGYNDRHDRDLPIILWWTKELFAHPGDPQSLNEIKCNGGVTCLATKNTSFLTDKRTRGIFFYGTDIFLEDLPLPRHDRHEWCLFHEESPMNNYVLTHKSMINLFNHTATFKRESDFPLTTQNIYSLKFLTDRKPVPIDIKNKKKRQFGLAPVVYVQSHCDVPSDRDRYVEELMKYIKIDSYGQCLHNKDLPEHLVDPAPNLESEEFFEILAEYKFHLAFENAVCEDYMTEKLFRPLHVGSVPVYYGSSKAKDFMPDNHSLIMVQDFGSPEELAKFLIEIDNDDQRYEEYLNYKKPGGITNEYLSSTIGNRTWGTMDYKFYVYNEEDKDDFFTGFECYICTEITKRRNLEMLKEDNSSVSLLEKKVANFSHLSCPKPFFSVKQQDQRWFDLNWAELFVHEGIAAEAAKAMLESKEENSTNFSSYLNIDSLNSLHDEL